MTFLVASLLDYKPNIRSNSFTYKSLRNYVQKYYVFPHSGCVRTLFTLYVYATGEQL